MRRIICPKPESLFEYVTVSSVMSFWRKFWLKQHLRKCSKCETLINSISKSWSSFFEPEPEVTTSLLKVYSRLQRDETLILKGWKFNTRDSGLCNREWKSFSGAIGVGLICTVIIGIGFIFKYLPFNYRNKDSMRANVTLPFAQIRTEDRNTIKVHYVQPELLNTIEFETADPR